MVKNSSFLFLAFILSFLASSASIAQTTDSNSVAVKTNQIVSLLSSKLGLTQTGLPAVQSLVSEFAGKFSKTNANVANSSGLKQKVEKDAQSNLAKDFSGELTKLLNPTQSAKYASVKDKVTSLFTQIK